MKKLTGMVVAVGLAIAATYAPANGYRATETGYVSDDDGRLYTYTIYGANGDEGAARVVTGTADVTADSRGAAPDLQSQPLPAYGNTTVAESKVTVGTPDVNQVLGRA